MHCKCTNKPFMSASLTLVHVLCSPIGLPLHQYTRHYAETYSERAHSETPATAVLTELQNYVRHGDKVLLLLTFHPIRVPKLDWYCTLPDRKPCKRVLQRVLQTETPTSAARLDTIVEIMCINRHSTICMSKN